MAWARVAELEKELKAEREKGATQAEVTQKLTTDVSGSCP